MPLPHTPQPILSNHRPKLPDIRCNSLCQESCRVLSQAPLGHSPSMCCCDTRLEDEGGSLGESCSCNNQSSFKERDGKSIMYVCQIVSISYYEMFGVFFLFESVNCRPSLSSVNFMMILMCHHSNFTKCWETSTVIMSISPKHCHLPWTCHCYPKSFQHPPSSQQNKPSSPLKLRFCILQLRHGVTSDVNRSIGLMWPNLIFSTKTTGILKKQKVKPGNPVG